MKRIITLIITVACYFSGYAQGIVNFASFPNIWIVCQFSEQYYSSPEYEYDKPDINDFNFYPEIINGKEYCYALCSRIPLENESLFFREEEGKVYTYIEKDNAEYLFYNFAALEGDEFDIYVNEDNKQCHCLVTKVDSVVIDNYKLKRITVNVKGDTFAEKEEVWIEGLGSLGDPLYNVSLNPGNAPGPQLIWRTNIGSTIKITQPINGKHYKGFKMPKPTSYRDKENHYDVRVLKADAHFEGDTLCFKGEVIMNCVGADYLTCYDDTNHNLYIGIWNFGLTASCEGIFEINFRIPGYADGVYKITDLDGTHEVVCGDIPEGIKPVVKEKDTDSYDIQGRKQSDDAHGIIIKDNRKVLKQ